VLLAAACGGGEEPGIERELAGQLATQSSRAAANLDAADFCEARSDVTLLQQQTIAAINSRRVPGELQEELLASINALLDTITCTPPAAGDGAADEARELADWLRDRSD
jgi:hypothetical protein